jgi:Transposase DDE domain
MSRGARTLAATVPRLTDAAAEFRQKSVQHPPWAVAAVLLWAALHDRPASWACDLRHWATTRLRPGRLPSQSTVSRRTRRAGFGLFLTWLGGRLQAAGHPALVLAVDGKPLLVGGRSHDPDAGRGRGGRGYKLHAVWGPRPLPEAWEVTPVNEHELNAAERLVPQVAGGGYLVADGNYDANRLYDAAAAAGFQLVAAQRDKNPGTGHHYQSPARRRCIALLGTAFGRAVYRCRVGIEAAFGHLTAFAGGLGPLPAWVRRRHRVEQWVWAKLVINAARILRRQRLTPRIA